MRIAARMRTRRMVQAPPIIPPICGLLRPLSGVLVDGVLAMAVAEGRSLPRIRSGPTVSVGFGAPRMVDAVIVDVNVWAFNSASVLVRVSV